MNNEKVKFLTQLAIYDKNYGKKDRKIMEYFKGDYIYLKNAVNRFGVYISLFIILISKFCYQMIIKQISIDEIDYIGELQSFAVFAVIFVIVYTVIGTYIYGEEYDNAARRIKKYNSMLDKLADRTKRGEVNE